MIWEYGPTTLVNPFHLEGNYKKNVGLRQHSIANDGFQLLKKPSDDCGRRARVFRNSHRDFTVLISPLQNSITYTHHKWVSVRCLFGKSFVGWGKWWGERWKEFTGWESCERCRRGQWWYERKLGVQVLLRDMRQGFVNWVGGTKEKKKCARGGWKLEWCGECEGSLWVQAVIGCVRKVIASWNMVLDMREVSKSWWSVTLHAKIVDQK